MESMWTPLETTLRAALGRLGTPRSRAGGCRGCRGTDPYGPGPVSHTRPSRGTGMTSGMRTVVADRPRRSTGRRRCATGIRGTAAPRRPTASRRGGPPQARATRDPGPDVTEPHAPRTTGDLQGWPSHRRGGYRHPDGSFPKLLPTGSRPRSKIPTGPGRDDDLPHDSRRDRAAQREGRVLRRALRRTGRGRACGPSAGGRSGPGAPASGSGPGWPATVEVEACQPAILRGSRCPRSDARSARGRDGIKCQGLLTSGPGPPPPDAHTFRGSVPVVGRAPPARTSAAGGRRRSNGYRWPPHR